MPIPTIAAPAGCAQRPDTLLVMLPGSYSRPEEFIAEGFVADLRERRIAADAVLVDAHVGYYLDRSIVNRLRADVIEPALAQGYTKVWLVGISIGAFGALLHAEERPQGIEGLVLLGPYLGKRAATEWIRAKGGLARWQAPPRPAGALDEDSIDDALWAWLQPYAERPRRTPRPWLFLGYGVDDRFAASDRLLGAALPAEQVFRAAGGHDWAPWRSAWRAMLETLPIRRDASCSGVR